MRNIAASFGRRLVGPSYFRYEEKIEAQSSADSRVASANSRGIGFRTNIGHSRTLPDASVPK